MVFSLRTDGFYWTFWTRMMSMTWIEAVSRRQGLWYSAWNPTENWRHHIKWLPRQRPHCPRIQQSNWGGVVSCAFKIDGLVRFNVDFFFAVGYCRHHLGSRFGSLLQLLPKHLPLQPLIQGLRTFWSWNPHIFSGFGQSSAVSLDSKL